MRIVVSAAVFGKGRVCASIISLAIAGLALGGCDRSANRIQAQSVSQNALSAEGFSTQSTTPAPQAPSFRKTEELSKRWQADPSDANLGLSYAASLDTLGQRDAEISVLKTVAERNPANAAVQTRVGKELLRLGDGATASAVLERATQLNGQDWQALSALGTAYDQQTRHADARRQYEAALKIRPGELSVENNLAMSYALQGKLAEAEQILRKAIAKPQAAAMPRIRQNLALVVGLQGRFEESQKIASADLPPDQVQQNLAYIQQMLARPNTWQQLSENQG